MKQSRFVKKKIRLKYYIYSKMTNYYQIWNSFVTAPNYWTNYVFFNILVSFILFQLKTELKNWFGFTEKVK